MLQIDIYIFFSQQTCPPKLNVKKLSELRAISKNAQIYNDANTS
jgi:hypothetical protein